ncbi:AraC family transcriptional regulator [Streptomyces sp. Act143]|uniref:helix-turn-helix domain-containing protein n=1 Tax=Streptomyces sp. Act143 TaxID=2200760 RepID=UPI000D676F0B|nr:helix-turn-helix domain-containing protein [Streptomyces sp. Act143]PWI14486.1 AraC family transcriptional regulator [Streptomyces sp. Act143]
MSTLPGRTHTLSPLPHGGDGQFFRLGLAEKDSVATTQDGGRTVMRPGDLIFCDPGRQRSPRLPDAGGMTVFRLPRSYLQLSEADWDRLTGTKVAGDAGLGGLVSNFLSALSAGADAHTPQVIHQLTRNAVDLLVVLVMELLQGSQGNVPALPQARDEMLSQVRAHIEQHLPDPGMTPQSIARANHISVRYLHKLFQGDGTTVGQWVRQRRLECCRRDLSRAPHRRITVAAVAHRWGFTSAAHFSRVFRAAYGMSPTDWQTLASS